MSTTSSAPLSPLQQAFVFLEITFASVLAFAATDLVLPAIPGLPAALGGTPAQAQYVLAAFAAGFALGLLLFGELGARFPQRHVLCLALAGLSLGSFAAASTGSMEALVAWRFAQGVCASAAATFAPGILRAVFDAPKALRAIGLQGSIEALIPALAPILGAWLLTRWSWRAGFVLVGVLALATAGALALQRAPFPRPQGAGRRGSYAALLANREFLRLGLSQACTLGALLVIVFGAPAVIVGSLGGTLTHFIAMQVLGVSSFIAAALATSRLCQRHGAERLIRIGSILSAGGCLVLLAAALAGVRSPWLLPALFIPVNLGLGLRGPPGFLGAIVAGRGDDARAAALVILCVLLVTAAGTALVAPFIVQGLLPLMLVAAMVSCASVAILLLLYRAPHDAT